MEELKVKTEQIVRDSYIKIIQIILQSRIDFVPESRTKSSKWFNLQLEEEGAFLEETQVWRNNIFLPLYIDIYCKYTHQGVVQKTLIEQWRYNYEPASNLQEVEVPNLYKKLILLIRTLYIQLRILPAYKVYKAHKKNKRAPSLTYEVRNTGKIHEYPMENETEYHFESVKTSYGSLSLSVTYSQLSLIKHLWEPDDSLLDSRVIIPDYTPNAEPNQTPSIPIAIKQDSQKNVAFSPKPQSAPIGIPSKPLSANSFGSVPETPPILNLAMGAISPPFSTATTNKAFDPREAFATTPPFVNSNPYGSSNRANYSFKLSVSPFKDSPLSQSNHNSSLLTNSQSSAPFYVPTTDDSDEEQPEFLSHLRTAYQDQNNEIGFFVRKCRDAPPLRMFDGSRLKSSQEQWASVQQFDSL